VDIKKPLGGLELRGLSAVLKELNKRITPGDKEVVPHQT
jgi:hypothetical protein